MKQKSELFKSMWGFGIVLICLGSLVILLGFLNFFIEGPKPAIISGLSIIIVGIIIAIWGWKNKI